MSEEKKQRNSYRDIGIDRRNSIGVIRKPGQTYEDANKAARESGQIIGVLSASLRSFETWLLDNGETGVLYRRVTDENDVRGVKFSGMAFAHDWESLRDVDRTCDELQQRVFKKADQSS